MANPLEFIVKLVDQLSGPAKQMQTSLGGLQKQLGTDKAGLADFEKQVKSTGEASRGASGGAESFSGALAEIGPIAAAAAAALAVVAGILVGGAALSLSAADFKDDTIGALTAITGTAEEAQATFQTVRNISKNVQLSEENVAKLATDLLDAGVKNGKQLEDSIQAVANLTQVRGEAAGGKLQTLIERSAQTGAFQFEARAIVGTGVQVDALYANIGKRIGVGTDQVKDLMAKGKISAGVGIDALNEEINKKLGGIAKDQLLDIDVQATKAKDAFKRLFEDVKADGFLKALSGVLELLDENSTSGQALKFIITNVFSGLFDVASRVLPYVKTLFLELIIVALKIYIAAKPLVRTLEEIFGAADGDTLTRSLVFIVEVLGAGIIVTLQFYTAMVSVWRGVGDFISGVISKIERFIELVSKAATSAKNALGGGGGGGGGIASGLANGITAGAGGVFGAAASLGKAAVAGVTDALDIHSPSRVMAELGVHTATGFAAGVDGGSGGVVDSMANLVAPPSVGGGDGGGGRTVSINVAPGAVVIGGGAGGGAEAGDIETMIRLAFERLAEQIGAT